VTNAIVPIDPVGDALVAECGAATVARKIFGLPT
jgi:hypothetical protein